MKHSNHVLALAVAAGVAVGGVGTDVLYAQEQPLKRTDIMREALGVAEGLEAVAYIVDAAPGAAVDKHSHLGDEFLYVLEGAVTVEPEGSSPVTLRQGEIFHQPPVVPHSAKNASVGQPARVLVFMVVEQGEPLAEPVQ